MKTNNPVRKSILLFVLFVIMFLAMVTMACDENPCQGLNDQACGLLEPNSQLVQDAIQAVQETCPLNEQGYCKAIGE